MTASHLPALQRAGHGPDAVDSASPADVPDAQGAGLAHRHQACVLWLQAGGCGWAWLIWQAHVARAHADSDSPRPQQEEACGQGRQRGASYYVCRCCSCGPGTRGVGGGALARSLAHVAWVHGGAGGGGFGVQQTAAAEHSERHSSCCPCPHPAHARWWTACATPPASPAWARACPAACCCAAHQAPARLSSVRLVVQGVLCLPAALRLLPASPASSLLPPDFALQRAPLRARQASPSLPCQPQSLLSCSLGEEPRAFGEAPGLQRQQAALPPSCAACA